MKLTEKTTALLSNSLIAPTTNQDLSRQRLVLSAVGAFDPYNKALLHVLENLEAKEKELRSMKSDSNGQEGWTIEDSRQLVSNYFSKNPKARQVTFDLSEYLEFWLEKRSVTAKNYTSLYKKITKEFATITYSLNEGNGVTTIAVFSKAHLEDGILTLHISPDFLPYMIFYNKQLQASGYTKVPLKDLRGTNMENTTRLYLLLSKEYKRVGKHRNYIDFKIEDLREGLGIGDKYEKYGDLDRHVLRKALETINSSNSFFSGKIKCKVTKRRKRAPAEVQFSFTESDKPQISPKLQEAYKKRQTREELLKASIEADAHLTPEQLLQRTEDSIGSAYMR